MKRREALKRSAFLAGCGLSAGTIASIISSCHSEPQLYSDSYLGNDYVTLLGEIVETILPETDTPGAKSAEVHLFIDSSVQHFTETEQSMFKEALDRIKAGNGKSFMSMNTEEREAFLLSIGDEGGEMNAFDVLKAITCQGFFTSKLGATEVLAHDPIPGEYRGCIDFAEVGKGWAIIRGG